MTSTGTGFSVLNIVAQANPEPVVAFFVTFPQGTFTGDYTVTVEGIWPANAIGPYDVHVRSVQGGLVIVQTDAPVEATFGFHFAAMALS